MKKYKSRIAIIEGYKVEKFRGAKIDLMVEDAEITPLSTLNERYDYSKGFIRRTLKEQGVTPKTEWGRSTQEKHHDASRHGSHLIPDLTDYGEVTARPTKHYNFYATNLVWK